MRKKKINKTPWRSRENNKIIINGIGETSY